MAFHKLRGVDRRRTLLDVICVVIVPVSHSRVFIILSSSLMLLQVIILIVLSTPLNSFWDLRTSTPRPNNLPESPQVSRWRWQFAKPGNLNTFRYSTRGINWESEARIRAGDCVVGITIGLTNLGTGVLLNSRTVITSANMVDPYVHRQDEMRIWALGRSGMDNTPFRYRVWRVRRIIPRSDNPEHWHGPRGRHSPLHDIAVINSWDKIYWSSQGWSWRFALKATLCGKRDILIKEQVLLTFGSGFKDLAHITENYYFKHSTFITKEVILNCELFLPKWWGKFICVKNVDSDSATPSGGPLMSMQMKIYGLGSFAFNINEDRIHVFTDLRFYVDRIYIMANHTPGEYYEYAYPEWGVMGGYLNDGRGNSPHIPQWHIDYALFPLGR